MAVAKYLRVALAAFAVALMAAVAWQEHAARLADQRAFDLAAKGQITLADSTQARLASTTLERDSLEALVKAAKQLGGNLIAGASITVVKHDTTIVHDTLPTQLASDSARTARFRDSTFAGIVSGKLTAPKCCAPLSLDSLTVERPAFTPQVGFVQVGTHLAAVVHWQGESVQVNNVYALPLPEAPKRVVPWVEGTYGVATNGSLRAGVDLRLFGLRVGPSIEQELAPNTAPHLGVTIRKEF